MHCKFCDKCVSHFDHHCQWLNTCVGYPNYPFFFLTVVSTFTFLLLHVAVGSTLIALYFLQPSSKQQFQLLDIPSKVYLGLLIAFVLFHFVSLAMVAQLLIFHVNLRRSQITTYEYIVRDNAKSRESQQKALQLDAQRRRRLQEARSQNNGLEVMRLKIGAVCVCCDPLRQTQQQINASSNDSSNNNNNNNNHDVEMTGRHHPLQQPNGTTTTTNTSSPSTNHHSKIEHPTHQDENRSDDPEIQPSAMITSRSLLSPEEDCFREEEARITTTTTTREQTHLEDYDDDDDQKEEEMVQLQPITTRSGTTRTRHHIDNLDITSSPVLGNGQLPIRNEEEQQGAFGDETQHHHFHGQQRQQEPIWNDDR